MKHRYIVFIVLCAVAAGLPAGTAAQTTQGTPADTLRLTVDNAVRYALRDGAEAAMVRQDIAAAEAQVGVALSYALPEITASGTYTRNLKKPVIFFEFEEGVTESFEIGQDNAWLGAISLRQTLWASGRVSSGYKMTKQRAAGARLAGDDAAAAIARDVKNAYYIALLAGEQVSISELSLAQAEKNVKQITARVTEGVAPEFERLRASVTVATRKPNLTRARNAEAIALESLKRLLGLPLDRPVTLTDPLEYIPYDETLDVMVSRALKNRRDLAAVRSEANAAEFQYKAQKANSRPLLYLNGSYSWQGETSDGLWPGDMESARSAAIGLSLAWPLMDGFRTKNEARVAAAMSEKAQLRVKQVEDVVRLQVRSDWNDVQSIAEEIDGAEQAVDVAEEAYSIAQVRYEKGLSTLLEMLDAELALIQTRLNLSETMYRYNVALANLEYSGGEGPRLDSQNGE